MSTPATVPIFDPQGILRDVPYEQMTAAVGAGGKPAVRFQAPDNSIRYVPADKTSDAVKAGGKLLPIEQQDVQTPGFWHALAGDLAGMGKSFLPPTSMEELGQKAKAMAEMVIGRNPRELLNDAQQRVQSGYSPAYAATAPLAEGLGVNVKGMEQSAAQGDSGGVMGHAAAVPTVMALSAGLSKGAELAVDVGKKAALLGRTPEEAYQSALKPSTTLKPAKVQAMVKTGLSEGIPVSKGGIEKLGSLVDDLNDKITQEIQSDPNRPINSQNVAQRADAVKAKFANQVNPNADLQAIDASKQEFLANNPKSIGAADAQSMKQGTYAQLKGKAYGELKGASIEAQKALARGLKEELATAFPELSDLNSREGALLNLQGALEKAVQREANHQLGGIGTPITVGAAKAVTGSNTAAGIAGMLKAVVDNPTIKSRLAIALSKKGVTIGGANARIAAYSAALAAASASNESSDDRASQPAQ